jgi:hypothetical protein
MVRENRTTSNELPELQNDVNEIAEYLELHVGPVSDGQKRILQDLIQRYGTAAVTLTIVSELSQLDMVTALLNQSRETLKKRKR